MRFLVSTKPIPVAYLKAGKDNGLYDAYKAVLLPGRTTVVRQPDYKQAGLQRKGEREPTAAPLPRSPQPDPAPKGAGLYLPRRVARERMRNR